MKLLKINKNFKTCKNGHQYYKSSDCPTCPICEEKREPKDNSLLLLVAPARRALENNGIKTLQELSKYTKTEVLDFHGIGPSSIPILEKLLNKNGLSFKSHKAMNAK